MPPKRFSDAAVRALEPRAGRYAHPDPEMPGHYVRISPNGAKRFAAVAIGPDRKQKWITIGSTHLMTIRDAREKARQIIKRVRGGLSAAADLRQSVFEKAASFVANKVEPACWLYRHYDHRGDMIYVGFSITPFKRNKTHTQSSPWGLTIVEILIEPFTSREEALEAERRAVREEFPRFNKVHNRRHSPLHGVIR
jgi:hypothetical protein